jgi:hypothetical protein
MIPIIWNDFLDNLNWGKNGIFIALNDEKRWQFSTEIRHPRIRMEETLLSID